MRIIFRHKNKKWETGSLKTGFLHDIAPRWFPPNALLQVTFRMNDGKVYLESYPKSMYFKPVNGTWSRISTDSFAFKPPFSISASQRGTYTVAFYLDKHERDVSQHTHLSVSGNNWQPSARFSTADADPVGVRHEEFATVSSAIISIKDANQASMCLSDLSKTVLEQPSVSKVLASARFRMHPSFILRQNPFTPTAQENSFSSVLDESSLSLTVLQPKCDTLYILTTCQDTSELDEILPRLLGGTNASTAGSTGWYGDSLKGKYVLIRRLFDLFAQLAYNWSLVMANRDAMLCLVDAVELWISPIVIFALLTNIPIYTLKEYAGLLSRCQDVGKALNQACDEVTSSITLPYVGDLQAITLNSSLSQTLLPSRESLLKASANTFYSTTHSGDRPSLPQTFFLPEIETTLFANANELLTLPPQTCLTDIQEAILKYLDWSLALTANRYTVWVRLTLNSSVYNRLSHEIDQIFCVSHCLTSTDMISDCSIILNLDSDDTRGAEFTIQNLCELFLRGPHAAKYEESATKT
ncbi:hypothetical protein GL50803_009175 [Giardia duodenalis]|uniref:Uncharacterized protein n=1 Tax=Giardia intestinalis (strain ATCC 50803 / WB clone C6) TaxID=184922 RepID=D3KH51_GIAIC|nr:hypothetical protein GL50803_009175 [Giardia intestinalis]KAE8305720.1 hypothetical protein GL50803_009175 [Giardia intestinalis]